MLRTTRRAWFVWGVGVLAYAVAVFQRTSLSVAAEPAKARFGVGAAMLSIFAVAQLIMYAAMQIPVGVLVDRFGSRLVIAAGALVMAAGQALLAVTVDPAGALTARILVGTGDAMTFICVLRLIPAWFAVSQVPLVTQLTGLLGQAGQVASTIPLVAALAGPGWTATYLGAAMIGVVISVAVLAGVRDVPPGSTTRVTVGSWRQAGNDLVDSFKSPGTRLGLWSHFTAQFSGMVFALLWGYPFMTVGLGYSPELAGSLLTMMVLAAMVIGPVLGRLTATFPMRRSNLIFAILVLTIAMWTVVLLWPGAAPLPVFVVLVLVLSAYGPGSAVGFDFARTFNPATRLGAATGIVNMGGFVASLTTIFVIGVLLDLLAGDGTYTLFDFKVAFSFQYVVWAVGIASLLRTRRRARAELAAQGTVIDPLTQAIARRWRARR
ncbi:MAG TPA: MFS transporter [Microlunatus sp.]|nr:MFS transporter [Microlunatus sp.]